MVRRVRTGNRVLGFSKIRLNIPRKGRIRAILIILFLAAGVKIFSHRESKEHDFPVKAQSTPIVSKPTLPKRSASMLSRFNFFKGFRPHHEVVVVKKGFSQEDVKTLLKSHSPVFQFCQDTIKSEKKKYIVHYSLDTTMQKYGEMLLKRYHPKYGAFVAMDPGTGRVLALFSYTREGEDSVGDNLYCKSIFPAASVFKTITAAGAIEKAHISPDSTFSLTGRRYTLYKFQLAPELRSFQDVSLADAYAMSINPVFGRIGIYVLGKTGLAEYMRKFGFNSSIPFDLENEAPTADENMKDSVLIIAETASGFNRVTRISPLFGAIIASSISEKGVMPVPTLVDSVILDSSVVYRASPRSWRAPVKESTASTLKELMMRVVHTGTARSSFRYACNSKCFSDVEYGGKTGSVDDDELGKIDWFIGFARHKNDLKQRFAVGVVTVHDEFWTVHSSFIGEELFRISLRRMQKPEKKGNRMQQPEIDSSEETQQTAGVYNAADSSEEKINDTVINP
jgi:cell division protein FtsI/penicillin-binding protein 2